MPEGVIQWFDEVDQVARIIGRGREYRAALASVEPHARRPGVRVHFDQVDKDGVPTATNVKLLEGTRRSRTQRRFGDLTGARRPGDKTETVAHAHMGVDVETQPARVARAWAVAMGAQNLDDAASLYAPDVVLHLKGHDEEGSVTARNALEKSPALGRDQTPDLLVDDRLVQLDWPATADDEALSVIVLIRDGRIVEQWSDGASPESGSAGPDAPSVLVVRLGDVPDGAVHYGEEKIAGLLHLAHDSVLFARLKLGKSENTAMETPVTAEATVDANGTIYRAHATGNSFEEAIDRVVAKLRQCFERDADRQRHQPAGSVSEPGEWRRGNLDRERPAYFDRPKEEREIVRHKSLIPEELTVEEAMFDMNQLDYDFFLFTELGSGQDTLISHVTDGLSDRLVVAQLTLQTDLDTGIWGDELQIEPQPAPTLAVSEAIDRLDAGGEPHVFFRNAKTDHGNVLYRRYDGHYGLMTTAP